MKLTDFKKKLLSNSSFRAEYEKYDLAFEIGQMILEARIVKGLTQERLASLIESKQSSIARAESGNGLPSLSFLSKIAHALGTRLKVDFEQVEKAHIGTEVRNVKTYVFEGVSLFESMNVDSYYPMLSNTPDSITIRGVQTV